MTFAEKLRLARLQAGKTQEELSAVLDVSKRTIIHYETGKTFPPSDKLPIIAKYFGVTIDSLMTEDDEFVMQAYERGGSKGAREAKELVNEITALFAGGRLSDDDKDAVMRAIQNAYWITKDENKKKYTPAKYRGVAQE